MIIMKRSAIELMLDNWPRVIIVGGPKTGKTTLSTRRNGAVRHTDDLQKMGWSEASEAASHWFDMKDDEWTIEGTMAVRALRKWLGRNPNPKLIHRSMVVIFLTRTHEAPAHRGEAAMAGGIRSILLEIQPKLDHLGIQIIMER